MHREYHPDEMRQRHAHAFAGFGDDGHDHHHHHDHEHPPHDHAAEHRRLYALTVFLGLLLGADLLFDRLGLSTLSAPFGVSLSWIAALIGGLRIVYCAIEALVDGRLGADFALAQACVAAIVLGEPFVAAEVVFIALVGEALEAITADRAMRAIGRLFEQAPRTARVRREGRELEIPVAEVVAGDLVLVRPGERVPVDGPVLAGRSSVDQAALTGESAPIDKGLGEPVFAGSINGMGLLEVQAAKVGRETTLGQVLRLVADAQHRKAPLQRAADRYARWFLPVVEAAAALTLIAGYALGWADVWQRAVAILVVACPCALVLATPAAVMAAMAWLARHGVIIKGGAALERLAACDTFVFDKTGTLTYGRPEPASVHSLVPDLSEIDVVRLAAVAEAHSRHPLGRAVLRAAQDRGIAIPPASEAEAMPGAGVSAGWNDESGTPHIVLVGNRRLMLEKGVDVDSDLDGVLGELDARGETALIVALDGRPVGVFGARDAVRPEAHDVIHDLKHLKITEIAILTGDRPGAARAAAKRVHVKLVESECLPADKARWITERRGSGRRVAMVGDGINDAVALASADVGIAIGNAGADLAAEAGDVVLLSEPLRVLPDFVRLSRATVSVIRQNILVFAFGLNAAAIAMAALGVLGPVPAAILHQVGSLLVLLNAMRLLAFGDFLGIIPRRLLTSARAGLRRLDVRLDPGPTIDVLRANALRSVVAIAVAGLLMYGFSGATAIGPDEVGLVLRNGRYVGSMGPGLHLRLPAPFERVQRVEPDRVRSVAVGFGIRPLGEASAASGGDDETLVMTGDGRLAELTAVAQYHVARGPEALKRFALRIDDPDRALAAIAEATIRSVVGRRALDDLLTTGRIRAERLAAAALAKEAERCGLAVEIESVTFQDVRPPRPVLEAYRDVSRAQSDRSRREVEARAVEAERLADARARADAVRSAAEAAAESRTARASAEAERFGLLVEARGADGAHADRRLYLDALAAALAGRAKVVLDPSTPSRRHLVLPGPTPAGGLLPLPAASDPSINPESK